MEKKASDMDKLKARAQDRTEEYELKAKAKAKELENDAKEGYDKASHKLGDAVHHAKDKLTGY